MEKVRVLRSTVVAIQRVVSKLNRTNASDGGSLTSTLKGLV
jgi:hypothetical protein